MVAIIGDIHGHYTEVFNKMASVSDPIDFWIQVGDMGGENEEYPDFPVPCYFVQGNHENWDTIDRMKKGVLPKNVHFISNGSVTEINGLKVLGLGGNYSPRYSSLKKEKIPPHRRRHYNYEEVYKALQSSNVDIFVTHEAPSPFMKRNNDVGQPTISNIIGTVKPKVHFFGHHHYYYEGTYFDTPSRGLEYGTLSCILYNPDDISFKKVIF